MLHRLRARVRHGALLFSALSLVLGASALFTEGASAQDTRTRPPPTAPQPAQVFNALSALAQTALVVEGTVKEAVSSSPRTPGPGLDSSSPRSWFTSAKANWSASRWLSAAETIRMGACCSSPRHPSSSSVRGTWCSCVTPAGT